MDQFHSSSIKLIYLKIKCLIMFQFIYRLIRFVYLLCQLILKVNISIPRFQYNKIQRRTQMSKKDQQDGKKYANTQGDETDFDEGLSFDSQETTFDEEKNLTKKQDIPDTSSQLKLQEKPIQISKNFDQSSDSIAESKTTSIVPSLSSEYIFPSIASIYAEEVHENIMLGRYKTMHFNALMKIRQTNLANLEWKVSFLKKIAGQDPKSRQYVERSQILMIMNGIKLDQIEPREVIFFKCECGRSGMCQKRRNKHLKDTCHKLFISIDTKKERKYQSRVYDEIGRQMEFEKFSKIWLYKSFEVMFVDAEIHYSQVHQEINKQFVMEVLKLKNAQEIREKYDDIQSEGWFMKKWIEIYKSLHETHKGKQLLCHKCLNFQQHLCLFALALSEFMTKNRKTIFVQLSQIEFVSVFSCVKSILKDFSGNSEHKKGIKLVQPKFMAKIRTIIRELFQQYLKSFDYIDINDFRLSRESRYDFY